jgi:hypothetical protein
MYKETAPRALEDDNISWLAAMNYRAMIRQAKANMKARPKSAKRESNK